MKSSALPFGAPASGARAAPEPARQGARVHRAGSRLQTAASVAREPRVARRQSITGSWTRVTVSGRRPSRTSAAPSCRPPRACRLGRALKQLAHGKSDCELAAVQLVPLEAGLRRRAPRARRIPAHAPPRGCCRRLPARAALVLPNTVYSGCTARASCCCSCSVLMRIKLARAGFDGVAA